MNRKKRDRENEVIHRATALAMGGGPVEDCEGPLFKAQHAKPSSKHSPMADDIIMVGPRYLATDMRFGRLGTFVLEVGAATDKHQLESPKQIPRPVAGIIRRSKVERGHQAYCEQCLKNSRIYARKNEPALWRWAHLHRCPIEKE